VPASPLSDDAGVYEKVVNDYLACSAASTQSIEAIDKQLSVVICQANRCHEKRRSVSYTDLDYCNEAV
jgi:hypothetical protein